MEIAPANESAAALDKKEPPTGGNAAPPVSCTLFENDGFRAVAYAISYVVLQIIVIRLRIANPLLHTAISLISLMMTVAFAVTLSRSLRTIPRIAFCLAVTGGAMIPFIILPFLHLHGGEQLRLARRVYTGYQTVFHAVPGLRGVLMICLAVAVGVLVSRLVREIKILLPIAVVLALVDLYVVFGGGLVYQANSGRSPAAQLAVRSLTVSLTPRPAGNLAVPEPLAVGFADFLFIALFFGCFARFGVPSRRTLLILCCTLCVYLCAVVVGRMDLPALLPIAVVVIGSNVRVFRYERAEAFAMLYAGILVVAILGVCVYMAPRR